jgi:hypothetical protein
MGARRLGRNKLPDLLWSLYQAGEFEDDAELLAVAVEDAWTSAEYPARILDFFEWRDLLDVAASHLVYPSEPVTLYRGVRGEGYRVGMSWTGSPEVARQFADRYNTGGGLIYRIEAVDPSLVLMQVRHGRGDGGVAEDEYVLDLENLDEDSIELLEHDRAVVGAGK